MTIAEILPYFDSGAALARACGCTKQNVSQWARDSLLAPEYVLPVCRATNWALSPHQIRSDIYPDPDWMPPREKVTG